MVGDWNGWQDAREEEREAEERYWEEDSEQHSLDSDDEAPWRGEQAEVHPPLEDVPGKPHPGYPGKDDQLEGEGGGHGSGS